MTESRLNCSSVELKIDIKKLIHIRGRHKGALTKSGPKNDLMLSRLIENEDLKQKLF